MKNALNPMSIKKYYKDQKPPNINELRQLKGKFTDFYFPPNRNSFISCDQNGNFIDKLNGQKLLSELDAKIPGLIDRIVWKRATEVIQKWEVFENKIEIRDIIQGNIGDCYFLSALSALTRYQYLIVEKFRTQKFNEEGYYEMILFIDGEWQVVFIDDFFPYDPAQKKFVGARPHRNELWALLLEKAWVKVNGGYTNTSGGIFSEAILALTGFPTEIFKHKKLEEPREVYDLYRNIEIGYKEGSIMACGTKTDDPNVTNAGLSAGHAYSIVYPKKWKERNIYLIKLRNPWGKNEWKGNWSDYSKYWTEEFIQYFHYKKANDGTLWIELNDFIKLFDTSYICHILYGALVKYFFFEYQTYFKKPTVFNLLLKEKATTSISILFKNFRFNREIHNSTHPFLLLLCKYNQNRRIEKIWTKWDCEDELNIVEILEPGYYCIWLYCPLNLIQGDQNFKYILQISSLSQYEIEFIGLDHDFSFIQYLIADNYKVIAANEINSKDIFAIVNNKELSMNGLFNSLVYNRTGNPIEVTVQDNGLKNCQVFPPYLGKSHFKMIIPPYESAAILGIRMSYNSGAFNFKYNTSYQVGGVPQFGGSSQIRNVALVFANYLKFNISNNSTSNNNLRTEEYKFIRKDLAKKLPVFNSALFSGEESLKQSMMIKEELNPQKLIKLYPSEFNYLFKKFPNDINPNIQKKWTKIKCSDGVYIGQINCSNGELEGRGVFYWKTGIRYIGCFNKNKLHGYGILIDKEGKKVFEGVFVDNKKNGFGKLYYSNGEYYEGDFENDKMEGDGIYHFRNGDVWEGIYQNKKKNGVGITKRKNGELFLTQYEEDNFIGEVPLSNEEKNYIENLKQEERKAFLGQKKLLNEDGQKKIYMKKNASIALFDLYKKKRDLTSSIIVFN